MFIDIAKIKIKAGDGGNGAVSFRREKYVAAAVPTGVTEERAATSFSCPTTIFPPSPTSVIKRKYTAENGLPGGGKRCFGKNGADLIIRVPEAPLVRDAESGRLLADVSDDAPQLSKRAAEAAGETAISPPPQGRLPVSPKAAYQVRKRGSARAQASCRRGAHRLSERGEIHPCFGGQRGETENRQLSFHHPFPRARRCAPRRSSSFVMADIPGLIEGAGGAWGSVTNFCAMSRRCRMLLHIVDVSGSEGRDPARISTP